VTKLLNLIQNENMKIYRRIRTWILIGLLVLLTVSVALIMKKSASSISEDWRVQVNQQIANDKMQLQNSPGLPDKAKKQIESDIKVNEYRLAHNVQPAGNTLWGGVQNLSSLVQLVTVFTVIIAADIVAGEFANGTIKLLLIRPARRYKILLSKYLATLLFCLALLIVLFLTSFIINLILNGSGDLSMPYLYASSDGTVHETGMLWHVLGTYGLKCVELIMIVTLAFMISTVFRSSAMSIGLSLVALFIGSGILMFIAKYDWSKFYLFANTDLTQYLDGQPFKPGMTMGFSITVLLVYFVIFNVLSWTIFSKRDVAA
jgi:ABC-2 type transport system permease protein